MEKGVSLINMENSIKGLLIKDWKLISSQRQFGVMVILFYLFFTMTQQASFAIGYCTVMLAFFTLTTLSYDELDNGAVYLFTMPIVRKDYVREKYLFAFLVSLVPGVVTFIISFVLETAKGNEVALLEDVFSICIIVPAALLILGFEIPFQLKFGQEKSRIALMVPFAFIVVMSMLLKHVKDLIGIDVSALMNQIQNLHIGIIILSAVCIFAGFMWISYQISCKIVDNKQF